MIFNRKKQRKSLVKENYIKTAIENSQPIGLETIEFLNMETHKREKLFPQRCIENWNVKLVICDVQHSAIVDRMFSSDNELNMIIILSFNTIHVFIKNDAKYIEELNTISMNMRKLTIFKYKGVTLEYVEYSVDVDRDKMQWFDKARLNAFMRAVGNIDFPVTE